MNGFFPALWTEALKLRRAKVPLFAAIGLSVTPFVGGLFMIILKDPEAARSMGLISTKAQLAAGTADWTSFFGMLAQAIAIGGAIVFAIVTAWMFGREFSDRTAKELLALPTSRVAIVAAKFVLMAGWMIAISLFIFGLGLIVGYLVGIPGWSQALVGTAFVDFIGSAILTSVLTPFVALLASAGRGYMPAFGWAIGTIVLAQIAAATGWGDWFPWSVPALFSGVAGPRTELLGIHSYIVIFVAMIIGLTATFYWWRSADQTK